MRNERGTGANFPLSFSRRMSLSLPASCSCSSARYHGRCPRASEHTLRHSRRHSFVSLLRISYTHSHTCTRLCLFPHAYAPCTAALESSAPFASRAFNQPRRSWLGKACQRCTRRQTVKHTYTRTRPHTQTTKQLSSEGVRMRHEVRG